jgi:plasmid stabilization system protein ParE
MSLAVVWFVYPLALALAQAPQAAPAPASEAFTHAEKTRLDGEPDIEDRVKLYEAVSTRHLRSVQALVKEEAFDKLPAELKAWSDAVEASRDDIEKHISRKKKSRALIRYEIHLRKAIAELGELKYKVSEAADSLEAAIAKAEDARKRFVSILFPS